MPPTSTEIFPPASLVAGMLDLPSLTLPSLNGSGGSPARVDGAHRLANDGETRQDRCEAYEVTGRFRRRQLSEDHPHEYHFDLDSAHKVLLPLEDTANIQGTGVSKNLKRRVVGRGVCSDSASEPVDANLSRLRFCNHTCCCFTLRVRLRASTVQPSARARRGHPDQKISRPCMFPGSQLSVF